MANQQPAQPAQQRNGHATVRVDHDEEPKGYPNSDRYHAETAHAAETESPTEHTKTAKPTRGE